MKIMGIDPSLRGCAVVIIDHKKEVLFSETFGYSLKEKRGEGELIKRNLIITQRIIEIGKENEVDFVAIEGTGASPKGGRIGNQVKLIELSGVIKSHVYFSLQKIPIIAPVASWKKIACGNGRAKKPEVKKTLKSLGFNFDTQDEFDALGVALYALHDRKHLINRERQ